MQEKNRSLYRSHRSSAVVSSHAVRWYFRFQLTQRDIEELLFEPNSQGSSPTARELMH